MTIGRAFSIAVCGVDGRIVEIEADCERGQPAVHMVGLPDPALQESRDRIRSAIINSRETWPPKRVVLALSPATLRKVGSTYDLALAMAVLHAAERIPRPALDGVVLLGELALDGRLRPVCGTLPAVLAARDAGMRCALVPSASMAEAGLVDGIAVFGASTLAEVVHWLRGVGAPAEPDETPVSTPTSGGDLRDVVGQDDARWALEVAAAGGHHLVLTGPPGIGKTMLAQRLPGLLPPLSEAEALEVTAIHSLVDTLPAGQPLVTRPPFIAPHHTTTVAALVGGGTGMARPGAVSRAHRGVLFLDEYAEMATKALEALRTPLEDGEVRIARRDGIARYPARFQLVLAANPCPCAPARDVDCVCAPTERRKYQAKLSGPLMDRVDLRVRMRAPRTGPFVGEPGESSTAVRERVVAARAAAAARWAEFGARNNGEVPGRVLRRCALGRGVTDVIDNAMRDGVMSARGAERALRVAWTIADLRAAGEPTQADVAAALNFRDRRSR